MSPPPRRRSPWGRRWEQARLRLLQVRVTTNEHDEPLWPRPLTPRGAAMLAAGLVSILFGLSYLGPGGSEVAAVAPVRDFIPPAGFASMWIVAGATVITLGPTRWWHAGMVVTVGMHGLWASSALAAYLREETDRGYPLAALHLLVVVLLVTVMAMLNPPRPTPGAGGTDQPTGPRAPTRRGKGRSDG